MQLTQIEMSRAAFVSLSHGAKAAAARRRWLTAAALTLATTLLSMWSMLALAMEAPEALIQRVAGKVFETVKNDPLLRQGDLPRIMELVDSELMPHVNFERMTASAVGRFWRTATPEQRQRLQEEFKTLLVRTYSGALTQIQDQTLVVRSARSAPGATEVVVRAEIRGGRGDPIRLDYRLEQTPAGWKVYDVNVMGVWLVETYRTQFAQEINANGIDGLIGALAQRNRTNAQHD